MGSFFVVQGAYMQRVMALPWGGTFRIPAASLALVNTLGVVLLIPLYDRLLIPLLRRVGAPMTLLKRIGWGLFVSALAMVASAVLEARRLAMARDGDFVSGSGSGSHGHAVNLDVWWQAPQYLLVGLSEVRGRVGAEGPVARAAAPLWRRGLAAAEMDRSSRSTWRRGVMCLRSSAHAACLSAAPRPAGNAWTPPARPQAARCQTPHAPRPHPPTPSRCSPPSASWSSSTTRHRMSCAPAPWLCRCVWAGAGREEWEWFAPGEGPPPPRRAWNGRPWHPARPLGSPL